MKKIAAIILALWTSLVGVAAQIVQFSGAPISSALYLVQQYGSPALLLSTTKENSAYGGNCMTIRRASDSATQALGWINTKECDATTQTTFCASTTCFLTTLNDQSGNGLDCVQATTSRQPQVIKDTDNKISIQTTSGAQGCEVPDNAAIQLATPELYVVRSSPCLGVGDEYVTISYGASGSAGASRWSWINTYVDQGTEFARNGSSSILPYGQSIWCGDGSSYYIMNFRPATRDMRAAAGFQVIPAGASTSITYSGTTKLVVGNNFGYTSGFSGQRFRAVVLYSTAVSNANRDAISNYLVSSSALNVPAIAWTYTSSDGYAWQTVPNIGYSVDDTDAFGNVWNYEDGGYLWSVYKATNLTNPSTTTITRHEVKPGDEDVMVNGEERAERILLDNHNPVWSRGGFLSEFWQLYMEPGNCVDVGSGWNFNSQHHTGAGSEPDNILIMMAKNNGFPGIGCDQLQFVSQNGSGTTARGSPFTFTRGIWYNVVIHAFWSSNGVNDVYKVYIGADGGGALTQIVNVTANNMFWPSPATQANAKQGIYSHGLNTPIAYRLGNWQWTQTQDAYTSFITSPPAVPAHNFLLKRDFDPASNDNDPMWLEKVA